MTATESGLVKLYAVEDVELYREVYKSIFLSGSTIRLLGIATNQDLPALWDAVSKLSPDVLLRGTKRLNDVIIAELQQIRRDFPAIGVVLLLVMYDSESINLLRGLAARSEAGMAVFLKQSLERIDQLYRIIASVNEGHVILDPSLTSFIFADKRGNPYLKEFTPRELELMNLLAQGYTNQAIAEALCIDIRTVQRHINNMYSKLRADNNLKDRHLRVSAARLYLETSGELLTTSAPR